MNGEQRAADSIRRPRASTPVSEIANRINGDYLAARRYATPLFEAIAESEESDPDMTDVAERIFQMGVNAAHAWYVLRRVEREEPERALALARSLSEDTERRLKRLRRVVLRKWRTARPGEPYSWDPKLDLGLRDRKNTFKTHRGSVPEVLR